MENKKQIEQRIERLEEAKTRIKEVREIYPGELSRIEKAIAKARKRLARTKNA